MAEPYTYGISSNSIEKIRNWANQQKAMGRNIDPSMVESMMKASLSTAADRASANYARNRELDLRERGMTADQEYRNRALEESKRASTAGAAGQLASTYMGLKYLGNRGGGGGTPDVGGKNIFDRVGEAGTGLANYAKKIFGTDEAVSAGTSAGTMGGSGSPSFGGADQGGLYDTAMEGAPKTAGDYVAPAMLSLAGGGIVGRSKIGQEVGRAALFGRGGESERGAVSGGLAAGGTAWALDSDPSTIVLSTLFGALGGSKLIDKWG